MHEQVEKMSKLNFACKDLGFTCDFEVKGVGSREEMVEIIKNHGKRCHDLNSITPEIERTLSKVIKE